MTSPAASATPAALRVGAIGFGAIAEMHARALAELRPRVEIVATSGGDDARVEGMLRDLDWTDSRRSTPAEILAADDVDAVLVTAPSAAHGALTLEALRRGKHVVVEKPLAIDAGEAGEIGVLAEEQGLVVSVIAQRRFEAPHVHVKALLEQGALGDVVLASTEVPWYRDAAYFAAAPWRSQLSAGGGALMNQGVHNVDLLDWLCGPVSAVTAQSTTRPDAGDTDATTVATVEFASGAVGTILTTVDAYPGGAATLSIRTTRGLVVLGQGEVLVWDVDAPPPPAQAAVTHGGSDALAIGHVGHARQWADIVDALETGRAPLVGVEDGVRTTRLLCAIQEASCTGRRVPVPASEVVR